MCNDEIPDDSYRAIMDLYCTMNRKKLGICIRKIGGGLYARYKPHKILKLYLNAEHEYGRLPLERMTLAPKLPRRFPFCPGMNPVLGNRHSALVIDWRSLTLCKHRTMPTSHWDDHDRIFFSTNNITKGWAGVFVEGELRVCDRLNKPVQVRLFLGCFDWNMGVPTVWLADTDDMDPVTAVLLESQLEHVKFEGSGQAQRVAGSILRMKLEEKPLPFAGAIDFLTSSWRPRGGPKAGLILTVSLNREFREDLCSAPVLVLNVGITMNEEP
jgi:hypothetical protein